MAGVEQQKHDIAISSHIGTSLQAVRVGKGQDLTNIAQKLHIQQKYLEAIERLDDKALPSLGYVLGYIRSYALHLGMDAQEAVTRYKSDIECPENLGIRDCPHYVPKRKIRVPKGSLAAGFVLSCMLGVVTWYGLKSDTYPAQFMSKPIQQISSLSGDSHSPSPSNPDSISLVAIGPSWVQIKDGNNDVLISRIMLPGEIFETNRQNLPLLSLRDAGAIELYRGGKRIGPIGQKGASGENIPLSEAFPQ